MNESRISVRYSKALFQSALDRNILDTINRDTAVGFYEKCGYKIKGDQFLELNIPHHVMEKSIF